MKQALLHNIITFLWFHIWKYNLLVLKVQVAMIFIFLLETYFSDTISVNK